jgi:hypothetical protein
MQDEFKALEKELLRAFPESKPKLLLFPSGAAMLYVSSGDETYVLEYHLDVGLGINRESTAVFGWEGYEQPLDNIEQARQFLAKALDRRSATIAEGDVPILTKQ